VTDAKVRKSLGRLVAHVSPGDIAGHPVAKRRQVRFHLVGRSFDHQLDRAVGQVPHVPGDGIALGNSLGRVPEAHALNPAGKDYALADGHATILCGPGGFVQWPPRLGSCESSGVRSSPRVATRGLLPLTSYLPRPTWKQVRFGRFYGSARYC